MKNKECDIIKDLLPSYVDNLCSEASKEWIEAHLAECEECRATAKALMTTEFSVKKLDFAQVDATKKVKKKQVGTSMVILSLCMFVMLVTAGVFAEGNSAVSYLMLLVELPIGMVITWFVNRGRQAKRDWDKWDTVSLAAAALATGCGAAVMFWVTQKVLEGTIGFYVGLELGEIGPFLALLTAGFIVVCLGVYIIQMVRLYKKGSINSVIFSVSLMGIFLMLVYSVCMHQLTDVQQAVINLKKATFTVLEVGLMGTAVLAFMDWWSNKQK